MEREYIVTLHRKEDLEQFYAEMESNGFHLVLKRPLSRNTHYMMTEEQAEQLRQDPRVWGVERKDLFVVKPHSINNEPYSVTGNFWKDDRIAPATVGLNDFQWGHLHCAGTEEQRDKFRFGSTNSELDVTINGNDYNIISSSFTIGGTTYPVRGKLWVPTNLGDSIDVVVCYHGTLDDTGTVTIGDAAETMRTLMKDTVKIKDKIIFAVAYPQDNISVSRNINMLNQTQLNSLYFGDNIVYARAALLWAKNSLNSFISAQGLTQQINKVFTFGHSQGGSLVHKLNTLELTDGVIANAPGPIRLDETCAVATGNLTCNKLSSLGDPTATPLSSNVYYQRSVANFVTGHLAKITYLQALDDNTGGPGLDGQIVWMDELLSDMEINNQDYDYVTVPDGGHDGFVSSNVLQGVIRNVVGAFGPSYESKHGSVTVFNDGKHVDVVIVDDPVSRDCEEWYSPTTNQTRFVEYQWFNELNSIVSSIDDDGIPLPTGTITYYDNDTNPTFHGVHVTGTVAGQHYGWAREANIYNLVITSPWSSGQQPDIMVIFDYLRAFHLNKDINPETGFRNPTITNHSYGGYINLLPKISDITSINYRGTSYNSSNPGPSGWSVQGIEKDFGLRFADNPLAWSAAIAADVQDAIDDGIVIIGAAGNSNYFIASENDDDWDNSVTISGYTPLYYHRGSWPNTPDSGSIIVGALSKRADFRRSSYTNYGPGIDVFAPGDNILSAFTNPATNNFAGLTDSKYTLGSGNWFYPINGTSMASPQVCGTAAILASGKRRFTNSDVRKYLNDKCIDGDMTFDLNVSSINANTFGVLDLYVVTKDNSNFKIYGRDYRTGTVYNGDNNPSLTIMEGDLLYFRRQGGGYPTTPFPEEYTSSDTDPKHGYENIVVFQDSTSYAIDGSHRENPIASVESNPDFTIQVGDRIAFKINGSAAGSPMYIKTALSNGTTNQVSGAVGQGATNEDDVLYWVPTSAGTYYYQSSTNYDANGTITVVPDGTYTGPHPLWIKTALGSGSTNALPSNSTGDTNYIIVNNGKSYGGAIVWPAYPGDGDPESQTSDGMAGTYYYQCGNHPGMYGTLTVIPRPTTAGDFTDVTARKGSRNKYLHVENPRKVVGYVADVVGERKSGMTFPRPGVYHQA